MIPADLGRSACTQPTGMWCWECHVMRDAPFFLSSPDGWFPQEGPPGIYPTGQAGQRARTCTVSVAPKQGPDVWALLVYKQNVWSHPDPLCLQDRKAWGAACTLENIPRLVTPLCAVSLREFINFSCLSFLVCKIETGNATAEDRISVNVCKALRTVPASSKSSVRVH